MLSISRATRCTDSIELALETSDVVLDKRRTKGKNGASTSRAVFDEAHGDALTCKLLSTQ